MPQTLSVHLLPALFEPQQLSGGVAVIIDILRASTTITTALFHQASCVIPCLTVDDALQHRDQAAAGSVLLGGERGGIRIPGFDLSNSPADYAPAVVQDRVIAFTTTNGTRALLRAAAAEQIVVGCFLNLSAIVGWLQSQSRPVHLICAGTDGQITGEDVLFAGAVVDQLTRASAPAPPAPTAIAPTATPPAAAARSGWLPDDSARIACSYWTRQVPAAMTASTADQSIASAAVRQQLEQALPQTQGGRNLLRLGYESDLPRCCRIDAAPVIPAYNPLTGRLLRRPNPPAGS